jgi:hypothetical protein
VPRHSKGKHRIDARVDASPTLERKSFLVLFFKKEPLSPPSIATGDCGKKIETKGCVLSP